MRALVALFFITGCTGFGPRIIVVVDSPLGIPRELDHLDLAAGPPGEEPSELTALELVAAGDDAGGAVTRFTLPASFAVAPREGRSAIELRVDGVVRTARVTSRTYVITDLRPGEARVLPIVLDASCAVCPTETLAFGTLRRIRSPAELDGGLDALFGP